MSLFDRAAYRVRQLRRTLWPRISQAEHDNARRILGPGLAPLFESMHAADQRHCLDVFELLAQQGCEDGEMLRAALIHDAGKGSIAGASFGARHRVVFVVLQRFPAIIDTLARHNDGLRSLRDHDQRTIELAREYGASDGIIHLLEAMSGGAADERALILMAADDQS